MVPRALAPYHQPISSLTLHAFGDASAKGVSAAVYAIVHQDQGVTQQLVCAKSGLAKKNLTIPRLSRWSHGREPCNKRTSSLKLPAT